MSVMGYRQIMDVDTASSLPMPAALGELAYAIDTDRFYRYKGMSWELIPNQAEISAMTDGKTAVRIIDNGIEKNGTPKTGDIIIFTDSVTTSGGNAIFSLTKDHTPTGVAYCSTILPRSISTGFIDNTGLYAQGAPIIGSNKTITVPVNKQVSSGVTVLGIAVLAAISNSAAPNGVTVNGFAIGIAA